MRNTAAAFLLLSLLTCQTDTASAQLRRQSMDSGTNSPRLTGAGRNPQFPYAGIWRGIRVMPVGTDTIVFQFTVNGTSYVGSTIHPDGTRAPQQKLAANAQGLSWEQPNNGGGQWLFKVRLATPDSLTGTIVLMNPPAAFPDVPRGTLAFSRVVSAPPRR